VPVLDHGAAQRGHGGQHEAGRDQQRRRSCAPGGTGGSSGRPTSRAEPLINADPDAWYAVPSPFELGEGNHADLRAALRDPAVVHGMCEDYRAGLRIDRQCEEADRAAGRRITCPMLLLAATEDDIDIHGDPAGDLAAVGGRGTARSPDVPTTACS